MALFADLETRMASVCASRLANATVLPTGGAAFVAQFDAADRTAYNTALVGDYTLRYLSTAASLADGDDLVIAGDTYTVIGHPERINAHESTAQLMRAA